MARQCVLSLEENEKDIYLDTSSLLLKVIDNILKNPANLKFRSIRIANPVVSERLLPAVGAMECLFEMGFQEGDDKLILPEGVSLDSMKQIRKEILSRREKYLAKAEGSSTTPTSTATVVVSTASAAASTATASTATNSTTATTRNNSGTVRNLVSQPIFIQRMWATSAAVLEYEDKVLQEKALKLIPLTELELNVERNMRSIQRAIKLNDTDHEMQEVDVTDLLLLQLLSWFKNSFFSWVDAPKCQHCQAKTTFKGLSDRPEELHETNRVEVYICSSCNKRTLFPRHTKSEKLLETRRGRCGEWAQCFTLMCRAVGWDARHVYDETDHVWTEVYSTAQRRWLHCDPCEEVCDKPLMYEAGWGKKLSYVIAYSNDDIQDVTWRYTSKYNEVLERRTQCSELQLLNAVLQIREKRQAGLSATRKAYLKKRLLQELVEFLTPRNPKEEEHQGRLSGSLAWRMARGEIKEPLTQGGSYTWVPTPEELAARELQICYSCEEDTYFRGGLKESCISGWRNGVLESTSIFRKHEKDWNTFYLSRTEGSSKGSVVWKFDFSSSNHLVEKIKLTFTSKVFENGAVVLALCGDKNCINVASGNTVIETTELEGSQVITLKAEVSGGVGEIAWQHAQLLRQQADDGLIPFEIVIQLRQATCR